MEDDRNRIVCELRKLADGFSHRQATSRLISKIYSGAADSIDRIAWDDLTEVAAAPDGGRS